MARILDDVEARVLGCLVEKSLTTPDLYPLTLNALVNACNQKSSREPVMSLDFPSVERGVNSLIEKGFAARRFEPGGRAGKFGHRIEVLLNTEDAQTIGLVCALLLRGPQTLGELKTHTERLCRFASVSEVDALLQKLMARIDGAIIERLPRQTGQKETRFRHLLSEPSTPSPSTPPSFSPDAASQPVPPTKSIEERLAAIEARLTALEKAAGPAPGA